LSLHHVWQFFSTPFYKGNFSFFIDNNDGTVEISSQLDHRAQRDADRIFGYDEDHGRIMESKEFIDQFIRILMLEGVKQRTNTKKDYYID